MTCTITIYDEVIATYASGASYVDSITIRGEVVDCPTNEVKVTINCAGNPITRNFNVDTTTGHYEAIFTTGDTPSVIVSECSCVQQSNEIDVRVECVNHPNCFAEKQNIPLKCEEETCKITIHDDVVATYYRGDSYIDSITIKGEAVNCTANEVRVTINCAGNPITKNFPVDIASGTYEAVFTTSDTPSVIVTECSCVQQSNEIDVRVECVNNPNCLAEKQNLPLKCELIDCFIATAAYQSPLEPEVQLLRSFRDQVIRKTQSGEKLFSELFEKYTHVSPLIIDEMNKDPQVKGLVKWGLMNPLVNYLKLVYKFPDSAIGHLEEPWKSFLLEMREDLEKWGVGSLMCATTEAKLGILENFNELPTEDAVTEINLVLRYVFRTKSSRLNYLVKLTKSNQLPLTPNSKERDEIERILIEFGRTKEEIRLILGKKAK